MEKLINYLYGLFDNQIVTVDASKKLHLQTFADEALIEGLLNFDIKNNGWRGILKEDRVQIRVHQFQGPQATVVGRLRSIFFCVVLFLEIF